MLAALCAVALAGGRYGVAEGRAAAASGRTGTLPIPGASLLEAGSTFTIAGHTASRNHVRLTGRVVLRARWNRGPWITLVRTRTGAEGAYRLTITLRRRGVLHLRLLLPGHDVATKTLRVR